MRAPKFELSFHEQLNGRDRGPAHSIYRAIRYQKTVKREISFHGSFHKSAVSFHKWPVSFQPFPYAKER